MSAGKKEGGCGLKGYKAFKKDMTCLGFQFEEGQTYETDKAVICESGFHFCENPLDTLNYYSLCESAFAEVEALGETQTNDSDSKVCTTKIKIGAKLGLSGFVKASVAFLLEKCKKEGRKNNKILAASGGCSKLAASGYSSKLAASGGSSQLAASGHYSQLAASGYSSQLAASGGSSQLAASGHSSKLAASGRSSKLAASGRSSKLAASGEYSQLAASGEYSQLAASGEYSQLAALGEYSKIAASGYYSKLVASGEYSQLAASGEYSQLAASGEYSKIAASGRASKLAASGEYSQLAALGNRSQLEITGSNSVGAAIGINNIIKAPLGCWITLAEYKCDGIYYIPICVKSAQVDGEIIKDNVWYKLVNGEFIECNLDKEGER